MKHREMISVMLSLLSTEDDLSVCKAKVAFLNGISDKPRSLKSICRNPDRGDCARQRRHRGGDRSDGDCTSNIVTLF